MSLQSFVEVTLHEPEQLMRDLWNHLTLVVPSVAHDRKTAHAALEGQLEPGKSSSQSRPAQRSYGSTA